MKNLMKNLAIALCGIVMSNAASAQDFSEIGSPNIAAIGFGTGPDYVGSDNYTYAAAPLLRFNLGGDRFVSVEGNLARVNVLDHPNWRFGPIGILRFGRNKHTDDKVVEDLPKIKKTVELGGFASYDFQMGNDPRNRWNFGAHMMHDVGGVHNGYVIAAHAMRWVPVGRYGMFGLNMGTTFGSGEYMEEYFSITGLDRAATGNRIKTFDADSGFRDVRAIALFIQPINRHWAVGAGGMYQRLVGDAADSPVVDDRGSKNQWIGGIGIGRFW